MYKRDMFKTLKCIVLKTCNVNAGSIQIAYNRINQETENYSKIVCEKSGGKLILDVTATEFIK